MALKIGQKIISKEGEAASSLSSKDFQIEKISTYNILGKEIENTCISGTFLKEQLYAFNVIVKKKKYSQSFIVKLVDDNYKTYYSAGEESHGNFQRIDLKEYIVSALEDENDSINFSIVFQPNSNVYTKLLFETTELKEESLLNNDNAINLQSFTIIDTVESGIESTLFPNIKEIGIQGRPGLRFAINGELFQLGKTGMFVLDDEDFIYQDIQFFIEDPKENCILDFKYKE